MLDLFLKNYIQNITKEDIINFSIKNNHILKDYEVDVLYNELNNIDNLLKNTDIELAKIKDKLEYTTYLKIIELLNFYKEKYKNYL